MNGSYRIEEIYTMLLHRGRVSIAELAEKFQVTKTTIRRDLISMEDRGLAVRIRGYALSCSDTNRKLDQELYGEEKRRIAEAALKYIRNASSLALDAGSTVQTIANLLLESAHLTQLSIVTNDLSVALKLSDKFRVCLPGGVLLPGSGTLVGEDVDHYFSDIMIDVAFLGTTGVRDCPGLTVSYPLHQSAKKSLVACANKKIAVLDQSKFYGRGVFTYCKFEDLDVLITVETKENSERIKQIEDLGVEVVLV